MKDLPHCSAWFGITLPECGPHKLDVIELVRAYSYLGLRESRLLVEKLPQHVAHIGNRQEAERCRAEFEASGAKVTMELHFPIVSGPGYYDE